MKNVNIFETLLIMSTSMILKERGAREFWATCEVNMGSIGPNLPVTSIVIEDIFHNLHAVFSLTSLFNFRSQKVQGTNVLVSPPLQKVQGTCPPRPPQIDAHGYHTVSLYICI